MKSFVDMFLIVKIRNVENSMTKLNGSLKIIGYIKIEIQAILNEKFYCYQRKYANFIDFLKIYDMLTKSYLLCLISNGLTNCKSRCKI